MSGRADDPALAAWAGAERDPHVFVMLYPAFRARVALALERAGLAPDMASAHVPRLCAELERRRIGLRADAQLDRFVDELAASVAHADAA